MTRRLTIVAINPRLAIVANVQPFILGAPASLTFAGYGGTLPYTWKLTGEVPDGMTWSATTVTVAGTPTVPADYPVEVRIRDSQRNTVVQTFVLRVVALPLTISGDLPDGNVGETVSGAYTSSGGVTPYTFSVLSGEMPYGALLNPSTGAITGTYSAGGAFAWVVRNTDANGTTADIADSAVIGYATLALSGDYADASIGVPYSSDLTIAGGQTPYSNPRATVGTVPAGLALSIVGDKLRLSGTPTTTGSVGFTAAVDSTDAQTAISAQTVAVIGNPHIAYMVAGLHLDGANGSTTFTDVAGGTWTADAAAVISTAQSKFGGASLSIPAANASIHTPTSSKFDFGSGDWTIRFWRKANGGAQEYARYFQTRGGDSYSAVTMLVDHTIGAQDLSVYLSTSGSSWAVAAPAAATLSATLNQCIELNRHGNTLRLFVDGEEQWSTTISGSLYYNPGDIVYIGGSNNGRSVACYTDDVEIYKGVALNTSDYTPPSAPFLDS